MQITVQNSLWTNSNGTWQLGNITTIQSGRVSLRKDVLTLVYAYLWLMHGAFFIFLFLKVRRQHCFSKPPLTKSIKLVQWYYAFPDA